MAPKAKMKATKAPTAMTKDLALSWGLPDIESKIKDELTKTASAVEDSMQQLETELGGYHLDTIALTLKLSEKILGTGAEEDIAVTFKTNKTAWP